MIDKEIPLANPGASFRKNKLNILAAIQSVLDSGWYILGQQTTAFEQEFAEFTGAQHCIGVGNGTDAISIALRAVGVRPGDEVITVSHSAVATVAAIEDIGAIPVFCDISIDRRCLNPNLLPTLISNKTKAVLPVHVYGQPADIEAISNICQRYQLALVEDCAQAHGAKVGGTHVGNFGAAGCFSFYPTKNLGALGDGGAIITNNPEVAKLARLHRQYGWAEHYISTLQGRNSRLDEIQAAILRTKLPDLAKDNNRRQEIAKSYRDHINGTRLRPPVYLDNCPSVYHLFVVESNERATFRKYLLERGIQTGLHYPLAIHQQAAYQNRLRGCNNLPITEDLYHKIVTIPLYPELTDEQVARICKALNDWEEGQAI